MLPRVAVCCSVLQCATVCCSVLRCVTVGWFVGSVDYLVRGCFRDAVTTAREESGDA